MRGLSAQIRTAAPFEAFLADLATLGVTPVDDAGSTYGVFAAHSNLRWWLLPLENRRVSAAGLEMLQPVSRAAKVAKWIARLLAQSGPRRLLGKGRIRLSGVPDLSNAFGSCAVHVAYFTGTDGPHRKTAVQVMDVQGNILGYAKLSRAAHIAPYIRNEADTLTRLADLNLSSADVPRVLWERDDNYVTMLVTDSLKSSAVDSPLQITVAHLAFVKELCTRTGSLGAASLLEHLRRRLVEIAPILDSSWQDRVNMALDLLDPFADELPLCLVHGDFTPWNCFVHSDRLYVFDWEYSQAAWPVGFDLVHFFLAITPPDQQLKRMPEALALLRKTQFNGDAEAAQRALLLSLVCHAMFYMGRLSEVNGLLSDWDQSAVRGALIDHLLGSKGDTL